MKKYLFLVVIGSASIFNSCSNNDNDIVIDPEKKLFLLSKMTTVYYNNPTSPQTNVATLEYNSQGQLVKTLSEGRTFTFEYSNGKPVKINYYNPDQTLDYYSVFNYTGDQLTNVKAIYTNPDYNRSSTYTYNSNGQLASSTLCQSDNCSNPGTSSYIYNGDNISMETSVTGGTFNHSTKREFSYDNKLNPFTYTNKYLRIMMGGAYNLSKSNYTTEKISYKDNDGNWIQNQNITYSIQYNNAQLPVEVIGKEANGNTYVKYNYEYITL